MRIKQGISEQLLDAFLFNLLHQKFTSILIGCTYIAIHFQRVCIKTNLDSIEEP